MGDALEKKSFQALMELGILEGANNVESASDNLNGPINQAYWLDNSTKCFITTEGEVLNTQSVFPTLTNFKSFNVNEDFYTIKQELDLKEKLCYKPVRLSSFNIRFSTDSNSQAPIVSKLIFDNNTSQIAYEERRLILVTYIVGKAEYKRRRQRLLASMSGLGWHHSANIATAGIGYIAFLDQAFNKDSVAKESIIASLEGIKKSFNQLRDCHRLVSSIIREVDPVREISLYEALQMAAWYARGVFAPDFKVDFSLSSLISSSDNNIFKANTLSSKLLPEEVAYHIFLELFSGLYLSGVRDVKIEILSPYTSTEELRIKLDRSIALEFDFSFNMARQIGRDFGLKLLFDHDKSEIIIML